MAMLEVIGIASILPFMSVVLDPSIIESNQYLFRVFESLDYSSQETFLFHLGILVLVLLALSNATSAGMYWAITYFSKMQGHRLSMRLLRHYLNSEYSFFLDRNTSDLGKNILAEIDRIVKGVVLQALQAISKSIVAIVVLCLLVFVNPMVALSTLAVIGGAYLIFSVLTNSYLDKIGLKQSLATFDRFRTVEESMLGIKEIKLHALEKIFINRFRQPSIDNARYSAQGLVIAILPRYLLETLSFGGIILLVLYLLQRDMAGSEVVPILSLYALAGYRLLPAIQNVYSARSMIKYNYPAFRIILDDLEELDEKRQVIDDQLHSRFRFTKGIEVKNLSFSYSENDTKILDSLNLNIQKNKSIGLIGLTGSGKTTLIDILLGLLSDYEGEIFVDNTSLNDTNIRSWQSNIGYVPQYIFLIDGTIESNIAFGLHEEEIDVERVLRACEVANLTDFLNSLPEKLKTKVGENGVKLSGGQRQRIGIARALYNNPEILVMDEATSSLDGKTEKGVMEAIENLSKEKTIIMVAHRLSTIKNCDIIYILDKGKIVESGTYVELSNNSEIFKNISSEE